MQPLSQAVLWDSFFSVLILWKNTGNSKQTSLDVFRIWAKVLKNEPDWKSDSFRTKLKNCLLQFFLHLSCAWRWIKRISVRHLHCFWLWIQLYCNQYKNKLKKEKCEKKLREVGYKQKCFRWWPCVWLIVTVWISTHLLARMLPLSSFIGKKFFGGGGEAPCTYTCTCIWCVRMYACVCTYLTIILTS